MQDAANDLEQLMNTRSMHLAKQAECMKKMRDLGSLPVDAFERYVSIFLKKLNWLIQLHNVEPFFSYGSLSCSDYQHINKVVR